MLNAQLLEAASWRIVAELIRRHSDRLELIETHQGGGQSDCLTLLLRNRPMCEGAISLNRLGSAHLDPFDGREHEIWGGFWETYLAARDPREAILELERRAGLVSPSSLAPSTPQVIAYRVIAAIVLTGTFGRTAIECRNGMFDGSGSGGSFRRDDVFALFPLAEQRFRELALERAIGGWREEPAYRFWFIERDGEPVLAVEASSGHLWSRAGLRHDLPRLWKASGKSPSSIASWVAVGLLD